MGNKKTEKKSAPKKKSEPAKTKEKKKKKQDSPKEAAAREEIRGMQAERDKSSRINDVICGLIYVAVGAFIFFAVQFRSAGEFGNALGEVLRGIFGVIGFVLPWYLIIIGLLLILHKASHFSARTVVASLVLLLMICLINSSRFIDSGHLVYNFRTFFEDGANLEGGGLAGMSIGILIVQFLGKAGLYIFSVAIILICLLLLLDTPLTKAYRKVRDRREEKKLMKEKQLEMGEDIPFDTTPAPAEKKRDFPAFQPEEHDIKIITPYNEVNDSKPSSKKGRSNVLDFMKNTDLFHGKEDTADATHGLEDSYVPQEGFGLSEEDEIHDLSSIPEAPVNLGNYDVKKASTQEIVMGAAEIGQNLGLDGGRAALTKSADKQATHKYKKPSIDLLNVPTAPDRAGLNDNLKEKARLLEETMRNFNVDAKVVQVTQGPAVTRYEIQPAVGVKVSKIVGLSDDIALNLRAKSIRIEAPIPGKAAVGIEVENDKINMVTLREIIDSKEFKTAKSKIEFAVGKDIAGKPIVADLKSMPHLLIAGSTGSGKSVCINSIITSILYKADPDEVKLVLIDPKVVELGNYNGIPHLLIPVVTEPSKAAAALNWAVVEMTNRYKAFAEENVRDLTSYNRKMESEDRTDAVMPQVVIIIDELADLMMAAPSQVEESICRLAQMARAAGMHLIVATQRPSVDIITGVIKANIPSRIAFAVSSQFDSRTILDMSGAEKLVGKGDMLFNPLGMGKPVRVQGTFVSDEEVERVIDYVKSQVDEAEYSDEVMDTIENGNNNAPGHEEDADELLPEAIECVVMQGQASVSMLQRRFRIGYNRAARIVDQMEARGIVGPQDGSRPRQVLISEDEFMQLKEDTKGM